MSLIGFNITSFPVLRGVFVCLISRSTHKLLVTKRQLLIDDIAKLSFSTPRVRNPGGRRRVGDTGDTVILETFSYVKLEMKIIKFLQSQ